MPVKALTDAEKKKVQNLRNLLDKAFKWSQTPQGENYWETVHQQLNILVHYEVVEGDEEGMEVPLVEANGAAPPNYGGLANVNQFWQQQVHIGHAGAPALQINNAPPAFQQPNNPDIQVGVAGGANWVNNPHGGWQIEDDLL